MDSNHEKASEQDSERRAKPRGRTFNIAKLIFGGLNPSVVDCLVTNLSATGARVETSVLVQVPEIMILRLIDTSEYQVRRAWTVGNGIGLEILSTLKTG